MQVYNYNIIFEREDEGGYHVFCPALKGCHSQGETYHEALNNIQAAMRLFLESLIAYNAVIPAGIL